ncbi:hypothetical protein [Thermococcus gorgonarius]|uniref:Uncharacterized protein n=1 Tax=Thermococcus gorgonarius TaxID=71997 RepID=A0A2Z2M6I7_THEGO|nr:hypothetical protein [Thermococcus gorgonarius]ASJ00819.1 hypothetical protein A3K92_04650 [Thermococcus gorgonarius]
MRQLFIEEWIQKNRKILPESSLILLKESISSYKANAYRAAIVMAWIAFLNIVKERLMVIDSPPKGIGLTKENWEGIKKNLNDEKKWDDTIFSLLIRKQKTPFIIYDEDREMIKYWKGIRNICAHGKRYNISNFHVEAFWQFMIDFVEHRLKISGEVESILPDVIEVYNAFGVNSTDFEKYLQEVLDKLAQNNLSDFLEMFWLWLSENVYPKRIAEYRFLELLTTIYNLTRNSEFKEHHMALLRYLHENSNITPERFIMYCPQSFEEIVNDNREILPRIINRLKEEYPIGEKEMEVFLYLLKSPYLGEETKKELSREFPKHISNYTLSILNRIVSDTSDIRYILLNRYKFFEHLKNIIITEVINYPTSFQYANDRSELSVWIIKIFGMDQDFVKKAVEVFSKENHPYEVAKSLRNYFKKNVEAWKKFQEIAIKDLGYTKEDIKNLKINPEYFASD